MLQTIWFFIKITLVVIGSLWLLNQPGYVSLSLYGYGIEIKTGIFLLSILAFCIALITVWRIVNGIFSLPTLLKRKTTEHRQNQSYKTITGTLVALTMGDSRTAIKMAEKTNKLIPAQNGLNNLLMAYAARLSGDQELAYQKFQALSEHKETALFGVRGLIASAMDKGDYRLALIHAEDNLAKHKSNPWLNSILYHLQIKNEQYDEALKTLKKLSKTGQFSDEKINSDRIALYHLKFTSTGEIKFLKKALKYNPNFVPSVTKLARLYLDKKQSGKAAALIKKAWAAEPHPDMAMLWDQMAPEPNPEKPEKYLKWYKQLLKINDDNIESYIILARAAMRIELFGEAKSYVRHAQDIYPSMRLLQLLGDIENHSHSPEQSHSDLLKQSTRTLPDKVWICKETGLVYDAWSPIAQPQMSFNTIIWEQPAAAKLIGSSNKNEQTQPLSLMAGF